MDSSKLSAGPLLNNDAGRLRDLAATFRLFVLVTLKRPVAMEQLNVLAGKIRTSGQRHLARI